MKRTIGEPATDDGKCPKCGSTNLDSGYGMAFGGMGVYTYCCEENCDWFFKTMDPECYPEGFEAEENDKS